MKALSKPLMMLSRAWRHVMGTRRARPAFVLPLLGVTFLFAYSAAGSIMDGVSVGGSGDDAVRRIVSGTRLDFACDLEASRVVLDGFRPNCGGEGVFRVMEFATGYRSLFVRESEDRPWAYRLLARVDRKGNVEEAEETLKDWRRSLAEWSRGEGTERLTAAVFFPREVPDVSWEEMLAAAAADKSKARDAAQRRLDRTRERGLPAWETDAAKHFRRSMMRQD